MDAGKGYNISMNQEIEGEVKYARSTKVYYNVTHEMYVKDTIGNENMGS